MAINIFSGNSGKASKVNSAGASSRAQAAKEAVGGSAVASASGNTAVKSDNALSKIGNTIGSIANVASKFLPGIGGTIASGIANLFNDPEWWQTIPGEQISMNVPQRVVTEGTDVETSTPIVGVRPAFVTIPSIGFSIPSEERFVMYPTEQMITQYLLPEIRKVVNAIPLQSASDYRMVLMAHATVYAAWRELKKYDYLLKHGQTYLPNLNTAHFPIFQVENSAWLQSTINRLEEYLRSNVRIPHTLCEYLAWRFGRMYKTCDSARAGLVNYAVIGFRASISTWNEQLAYYMSIPTSTEGRQKANADLYNAYFDHDLMVEIRDDTQLQFDAKEFALRTNCDFYPTGRNGDNIPVFLDSKLDNATVFMASTVSTSALNELGDPSVLFPVNGIAFTYYADADAYMSSETVYDAGWNTVQYAAEQYITTSPSSLELNASALKAFLLMKACDVYNKNVYVALGNEDRQLAAYWDVTQLNMDMALTTDTVISNEHIFAFANLVTQSRKRSMTMGQANKVAAGEVANMVEKLDIAAIATPKK